MKTKYVLAAALSLVAFGVTTAMVEPQEVTAQSANPTESPAKSEEKSRKPLELTDTLWREIILAQEALYKNYYGCMIPIDEVRPMVETLAKETGMHHSLYTGNLVRAGGAADNEVLWLEHTALTEAGSEIFFGLMRNEQHPEKWVLMMFPVKSFPANVSVAGYAMGSYALTDEQTEQLFGQNYFTSVHWNHPMLKKADLNIKRIRLGDLLDTYLYNQPKIQFIAAHGGDREVRVESGDLNMLSALRLALGTVGGSIEDSRGKSVHSLNVTQFRSDYLASLMRKEAKPRTGLGYESINTVEEAIDYMKKYTQMKWDEFNEQIIVKLPNS